MLERPGEQQSGLVFTQKWTALDSSPAQEIGRGWGQREEWEGDEVTSMEKSGKAASTLP